MIHVVKAELALKFLPHLQPRPGMILRGAGGHRLQHFGTVRVHMVMGDHRFVLTAEVADVRHNLLSVAKLEDHGHQLTFVKGGSRISRGSWAITLDREHAVRDHDLYKVHAVVRYVELVASDVDRSPLVQPVVAEDALEPVQNDATLEMPLGVGDAAELVLEASPQRNPCARCPA